MKQCLIHYVESKIYFTAKTINAIMLKRKLKMKIKISQVKISVRNGPISNKIKVYV